MRRTRVFTKLLRGLGRFCQSSGSRTVEQFLGIESVDYMLHHNDRPLGSEMVAANMIRFGFGNLIVDSY